MLVRPGRIVTDVNDEQFWKALLPIYVTLVGMVSDVNDADVLR